jgi:hypothetical protein
MPSIRSLANRALQQLMQGLPAPVELSCLEKMLQQAHPELCALLLQCVRTGLAGTVERLAGAGK